MYFILGLDYPLKVCYLKLYKALSYISQCLILLQALLMLKEGHAGSRQKYLYNKLRRTQNKQKLHVAKKQSLGVLTIGSITLKMRLIYICLHHLQETV